MLARHDEHILSWLSQRPLGGLFMSTSPSDNVWRAPTTIGSVGSLSLTPKRGESAVMVKAFNSSSNFNSSIGSNSSDQDVAKYNPLYKTNYCREFTINGRCPFQEKCHFAHGIRELRPMPSESQAKSPNSLSDHVYKTELCTVFIKDGSCRYGVRCHFAHGLQELRPRSTAKTVRSGNCLQWSASRTCRFGDACKFQHD